MRKLASYLLTLLFIIAYGHCMAEQLGALHNSDTRCCAPVCQTSDHCSADDGHHHDQENNDTPDEPTPCQLCFILKTDSVLLQDGVKVPAPVIIELPDYTPVTITLRGQLLRRHPQAGTRSARPTGFTGRVPCPTVPHQLRHLPNQGIISRLVPPHTPPPLRGTCPPQCVSTLVALPGQTPPSACPAAPPPLGPGIPIHPPSLTYFQHEPIPLP